jgi:hypothetical protein
MAWLCLKDDAYRNSQMCIVTGPNQDIAIKLIKRMKGLFEPHNITFANKETVLELNGCTVEAFPSNHLDAYRALDNPKFILLDEADFFRKSEQGDVRHVSERYIAKADPYIVMVTVFTVDLCSNRGWCPASCGEGQTPCSAVKSCYGTNRHIWKQYLHCLVD